MDARELTGRKAHVRLLTDAIDRAKAGHAQTITVFGEPGSGKTSVLDAVAARAEGTMRVLRVAGHPAEQDLPYAGVHQLVHQAGLGTVLASGEPADPLRDAAALLEAVTTLARDQPVLVVIDDAQWLDRLSHRALVFVARRLDADAVCVLFGVRSPKEDRLMVGTSLEVGPLTPAESVELLRRAHPDMSARVAARIATTAHGMPLALSEIPMDLSAAQLRGTAPLPEELSLGRSLTPLFADRIAALPDATRLCLLAAAFDALSREAYREVLAELNCALADLDAAERAGLARVEDGRCGFRHPLVAAAVRAAARAQERVAVHRALARQFTSDPVRLAFHLRQDPDVAPARLQSVLQQGAEVAGAALSYDEAAQLWAAAAELMADAQGKRALLRKAVRCLALAGAGPEARTLVDRLLAETTEVTERAQILQDLTWVSLWTRSVAPADHRAIEAQALELVGMADANDRLRGRELLAALATAMLGAGEYQRAHEVCQVLTTEVGEQLSVEQRLLCGVVAVMVGEPRGSTILRHGEAWVESYPWSHVLDPATPAGFITVILGWLGEYEILDRVIALCKRAAIDQGASASGLYIANSMTASRERYLGRWDRAVLEFENLEQIVSDSDFAAPYPFIALRHAHLLAARGDVQACERQRARARERAPEWVPILEHLDHAVAGLLALANRDFAVALEHLDHAGQIEREVGLAPGGYLTRLTDAFEAAWRLGDATSRHEELAEFEDAMRAMEHQTMLGLAARCHALVAGTDQMDERFGAAIELLSREPDGFEVARTYLLWGERLRRARRKADAHQKLARAHQTFVRLGANVWAEQCAAELAACGVRRADVPELSAGGPLAELTPREFEVAREVATGLSNADAARRLFISERTVEFHLYNVFRKLDIEGREALGEVLNR